MAHAKPAGPAMKQHPRVASARGAQALTCAWPCLGAATVCLPAWSELGWYVLLSSSPTSSNEKNLAFGA